MKGRKAGPARTRAVAAALEMAAVVREAEAAAIGEIVGETGTGKTMAGRAVAEAFGALRIAAWQGVTRYQLLRAIAEAAGVDVPAWRAVPALAEWAAAQGERPLLLVDEANKLRWDGLELVRYLADECGFGVILIGTELYESRFVDARTRPLLLQLGRRIGAKRVRMGPLDRAETYEHVIRPRFGDVADKAVVQAFWEGCRKGYWGEAVELAEACARAARAAQVAGLAMPVVQGALKYMANRRVTAGAPRLVAVAEAGGGAA